MKKLLMFLGALTFVTQAQCMQTPELLTVDNDSNCPVRLNLHNKNDKQYSESILAPGARTVLDLTTLNQDPEQFSHITITLEDNVKGKINPQNILKKSFLIQKNISTGTIRITPAITDYLKLNQ